MNKVLLIGLVFLISACSPSKQAANKANKELPQQIQHAQEQNSIVETEAPKGADHLNKGIVIVDSMTPQNLPDTKPKALAELHAVGSSFTLILNAAPQITKDLKGIGKNATTVIDRNTALENDDPWQFRLELIGLIAVGIAIAQMVMKLFPQTMAFTVKLEYCLIILLAGALTWWVGFKLPQIERVIEYILAFIIVAGLTTVGILLWREKGNVKAVQADLAKTTTAAHGVISSIDAAISAGAIDLTKAAPFLNAVQSVIPGAKALVDKVQAVA